MPKGPYAWLISRQIQTAPLPKKYLPAIIVPIILRNDATIEHRNLRVGCAVAIAEPGTAIPAGVTILVLRSAQESPLEGSGHDPSR